MKAGMEITITQLLAPLLSMVLLVCQPVGAAENKPAVLYEDKDVLMQLFIRTPEQLSGFYQGRAFDRAAIDRILATCFITPIIHNKTLDVLWLDLDAWTFMADGQSIARIKRDAWKKQWRDIDLPQAQQSTFGWTLMPEVRDLRLDESVGGSVAIPWQTGPFTLIAHFPTGASRQGKPKTIHFEGLECATDTE